MTYPTSGVGLAKVTAIGVTAAQAAASVLAPGATLPPSMTLSARTGNWVPQALMNVYNAIGILDQAHRL